MEFIVGDYYFEDDMTIGFADGKKKTIKIRLTSEETQRIKNIFANVNENVSVNKNIIERKNRLEKLISIETEKAELKKYIKELEQLETEKAEFEDEQVKTLETDNEEFNKLVFKEEYDNLIASMSVAEFERLSEYVGFKLVEEYLKIKNKQYTSMIRQENGNK